MARPFPWSFFPFPKAWALFLLFLGTLLLLSYFPFSPGLQTALLSGGLVLPLGWMLVAQNRLPPSRASLLQGEFLPPISPWVWFGVFLLGVFFRFNQLTTLSNWPMPDEGNFAYYSLELSRKWNWRFFYTPGQHPALFNWCLGLFFKIIPPSLYSLWLFPALFSLATWILACLAARKFFSSSTAFLGLALMGTSFWPLYAGRFCNAFVLAFFWEVLSLAALVFFLRSPSKTRLSWAWALGAVAGIGFFTSILWVLAALMLGLAVLVSTRSRDLKLRMAFLSPVLLGGLLFFILYFTQTGAVYLGKRWAFHGGMDVSRQLSDSLSNIRALFWGGDTWWDYGPVWGGLLNPVLGALFFLGLLEAFRNRRQPFIRWTALGLFLFLLPGLVSRGMDSFRILFLLPFLLLVVSMGLGVLLRGPSFHKQGLLLLLTAGCLLDAFHLFGPYHQTWGTPNEDWKYIKGEYLSRAYDLLEANRPSSGPGLVLSDLRPDVSDQTLTVAAYAFDGAHNPGIGSKEARWVALLVNADEKGFLARQFPEGRWFWLGREYISQQWMMLGVIPLDGKNREALERWAAANKGLESVTAQVLYSLAGQSQGFILESLAREAPLMAKDRFLETCYWEKMAFHLEADRDEVGALQALRQAVQKGYPAAHLFNAEGVLLSHLGRVREAREAFEKAVRCPMNFTPAGENLKALK